MKQLQRSCFVRSWGPGADGPCGSCVPESALACLGGREPRGDTCERWGPATRRGGRSGGRSGQIPGHIRQPPSVCQGAGAISSAPGSSSAQPCRVTVTPGRSVRFRSGADDVSLTPSLLRFPVRTIVSLKSSTRRKPGFMGTGVCMPSHERIRAMEESDLGHPPRR